MTLSTHVRRSTLHPSVGSRPIGRLSRGLMTIPLLCGMFACQFPHHVVEGARINEKAKAQTMTFGGGPHAQSPTGQILQAREVDSQKEAELLTPPFTLEKLGNLALRYNPTLAQAVGHVEAEEAKALQAGLFPNPILGFSGLQFFLPSGGPIFIGGFAKQEFITGGKLRLSREKFLMRASLAEIEALEQMFRVTNSMRINYFTVLGAQRILNIQKERLQWAQDQLGTAQGGFNKGVANGAVVRHLQIVVQERELKVLEAENSLRMHWENLVTTIGKPLPLSPLEDNLEADLTPPLEFDKELERMLDASPELAHAELFVKFDRIKVQREQVEPIPNLTIVAGGGVNHEGAPRAGPGPWNVANVDVSINVPIFDRNQGTILQAKTALKNAQYEITRMQLDLRRRLADAFGMYRTSLQYVQALQNVMLPQAEARYRTQLKNYQENRADWQAVLEAQDDFFTQRQNHVVRLVQLHIPRVLIKGFLLSGGPPPVGLPGDPFRDANGLTPVLAPDIPGHITATPKPR
ncbi:MAG: Heavy metal RND efflux outer membrane protein, CzcC family [Nitrospira sp.]|nr:MAG: Heavy metal RND efflux outer membrane protein, CzcC family [Nitrospira sp.]